MQRAQSGEQVDSCWSAPRQRQRATFGGRRGVEEDHRTDKDSGHIHDMDGGQVSSGQHGECARVKIADVLFQMRHWMMRLVISRIFGVVCRGQQDDSGRESEQRRLAAGLISNWKGEGAQIRQAAGMLNRPLC